MTHLRDEDFECSLPFHISTFSTKRSLIDGYHFFVGYLFVDTVCLFFGPESRHRQQGGKEKWVYRGIKGNGGGRRRGD